MENTKSCLTRKTVATCCVQESTCTVRYHNTSAAATSPSVLFNHAPQTTATMLAVTAASIATSTTMVGMLMRTSELRKRPILGIMMKLKDRSATETAPAKRKYLLNLLLPVTGRYDAGMDRS